MNRNRIFYIYQEPDTITNIVFSSAKIKENRNNKPNNTAILQTTKDYLALKAKQFINFHNKNLDIKEYELYTFPAFPRYVFLVILTKTNTNHPYGLFVNLDTKYLYFTIPFGGERKQADIDDYQFAITNGSIPEIAMIYILLEKTILIRKKAILTIGQFNLLDCKNITNCIKKKHEIGHMNISYSEKQALMNKYNEQYLNKAIDILKKYFSLLNEENYDEAFLFLKGKSSKYFGKERVNTFFKNTKKIIGHLEIFILLYELFHSSRYRLSQ
jgi:hypothetical protein